MKINGFVPSEAVFNNSLNNNKEIGEVSFNSFFRDSLDKVNEKQVIADDLTKDFVSGKEGIDINDVMLAGEEAKISLQLAVQIRNKVVEAVQELTRMQL